MHIRILKIGKTANEYLPLEQKFITYLQPNQLEILSLPASRKNDPTAVKVADQETLSAKIKPDWPTILLTEFGKQLDTPALADHLQQLTAASGRLQLVLGGAFGFTNEFKRTHSNQISLSPLTFPHDLAFVVLLEQLYRIVTMWKGKTYHY
ncbi:50S rRNA methyltransferase [Candidatus Peregrinibacteria bacterium CG11_big_fil_rev_8_21_14_0_20_41_10]|nr:MAG: 50S rRNA methyltransferase [Candidatus Peregrinibacteria bacterium CG11_big_fil_rev_8_21_14_0_20_41_10]PIZ73763.1 MAG: 50S rRNA methyltransferase [Candidatus Peregrinibacteria bacterium CG_4_10_14_0_2_um_filter_41_8]PJC37551.1 MAG: 50S rRNA methyltransferase [Candidatus Peregrinibacteria bacterium CG_4_9_14_0_2_um_filter_41_14]